jgi:hypothetical protein
MNHVNSTAVSFVDNIFQPTFEAENPLEASADQLNTNQAGKKIPELEAYG